MEKIQITPKMKRQRKLLLILPLIVFPFLTLLLSALGMGKTTKAKPAVPQGLNMSLPQSVLAATEQPDKLGFYDQAQKDSLKLAEQRKSDPYAQQRSDTPELQGSLFADRTGTNEAAANETQIYQRLAVLKAAVNKPAAVPAQANPLARSARSAVQRTAQEDPELRQMSGLLEKIMDIQHPERVKARNDTTANIVNETFRAIPATIDGKQKITEGTVIRLKLLDSATIAGHFFPKGQLVFVSGTFYNQRLSLHIKSIHQGTQIYPVDLTVFDERDGLEGVCVPEAITSNAVRDGSANAVQSMQFLSMDQSMATQAASAGLNAAKGLFSKKVKMIKAKLQDGHALLLRDNQKLKEAMNLKK